MSGVSHEALASSQWRVRTKDAVGDVSNVEEGDEEPCYPQETWGASKSTIGRRGETDVGKGVSTRSSRNRP